MPEQQQTNKKVLTIMAARNGWTIRTRSGVYICTSIEQLLTQVKSYALVLQKEAAKEPLEQDQEGGKS